MLIINKNLLNKKLFNFKNLKMNTTKINLIKNKSYVQINILKIIKKLF